MGQGVGGFEVEGGCYIKHHSLLCSAHPALGMHRVQQQGPSLGPPALTAQRGPQGGGGEDFHLEQEPVVTARRDWSGAF